MREYIQEWKRLMKAQPNLVGAAGGVNSGMTRLRSR